MISALFQPNREVIDNLVEEIDLTQLPDDFDEDEQPEQPTDPADEIAMTNAYGQEALRHHHFDDQKKKIEELKCSRARLENAHEEMVRALRDHKTLCQQLMVIQQTIGGVAACNTNRDAVSGREFLNDYMESNSDALDVAFVSVLFEFSKGSSNGKKMNAIRRELTAEQAKWTKALEDSEDGFYRTVATDSHNKKRAIDEM
jgi:hypothetical protein